MAERRRSRDPLGLRRALSGKLLPGLVAAMALLAALALAGAHGAAALAERWQYGAAAAVTAQVPDPTPERMAAALSVLRASPRRKQWTRSGWRRCCDPGWASPPPLPFRWPCQE